jgi:trimeric autotransporter adhesin
LAQRQIADGRPRNVGFFTDLNGQVIKRDEGDQNLSAGDPHEIWYRFGGKEIGYVSNNGTLETSYSASIASRQATTGSGAFFNGATTPTTHADFDQSLTPITSYAQGSLGGTYAVLAGETLSSIAARLWGDSSLWYKLAEANGLAGDAALFEKRDTHALLRARRYRRTDAGGV